MGFCWGGGQVNNLAVAELDLSAGVAYYGRQADAADVPKIEAALLLQYAGQDERINAGIDAYKAALEAAGKDFTIYMYEGAQHAFNNDTSAARYNKAAADLPDHTKLKGLRLPGASVVLDRRGERFAEVFEENQRRVWVVLADIPEHVQKAFLAAEDRRFYLHGALDLKGTARAFVANLRSKRVVQGGSTITQQIAKTLFLKPDRTLKRKLQEAVLAYRLERKLTKDEVLELYLSRVFFGSNAYGLDAAAQTYFGRGAQTLSLSEAALLAGLPQAPSRLALDAR